MLTQRVAQKHPRSFSFSRCATFESSDVVSSIQIDTAVSWGTSKCGSCRYKTDG